MTFFGFYAFWACYLNLYSTDYLELTSFGFTVCKAAIIVVNFKLLLVSRHWDPLFVGSVAASLIAFYGVTLAYHAVRVDPTFANWLLDADFPDDFDPVPASFETFWVAFHALSSWGVWALSIWVTVVCLLPDLAFQVRFFRTSYSIYLHTYLRTVYMYMTISSQNFHRVLLF